MEKPKLRQSNRQVEANYAQLCKLTELISDVIIRLNEHTHRLDDLRSRCDDLRDYCDHLAGA